jgi:hypothetical protein
VNLLKSPKRLKWAVSVVVVAALGFGYAAQASSAAPTPGAPRFSAVDIVDAVAFNQGPAAQYLGDLERPTIQWTPDVVRTREVINSAILSNTAFAQSFATRMQSGDPVQITAAVDELSKFSREAMNNWLGKDNVDRALSSIENGSVAIGLVWYRWIWIYRFIWIWRYFYWFWARDFHLVDSTNARLPDELTVRSIALNLRAASPV